MAAEAHPPTIIARSSARGAGVAELLEAGFPGDAFFHDGTQWQPWTARCAATPQRLAVRRYASDADARLFCMLAPDALLELELSDSRIGDEGLACIAALDGLKSLLLEGLDISVEGLDALSGLAALERLSLARSGLSGTGIGDRVARFTRLEQLNLYRTPVDDAELEAIAGLASLRYLNLSVTTVTDGVWAACTPCRAFRNSICREASQAMGRSGR